MGSVANPMFSGVVPGGFNPTGNQIALMDVLSSSGSKGANPLLPATTPATSVASNPYDVVPSSTTSSFPANTGPYTSSSLTGPSSAPTTNVGQAASSPFSFLNSMSPTDLSRMFNSLKKTYGDGMAHMILDFLTSGAGFNQQAINNLLASLQPGIERGEEDLMSQFSASGNRFGSGAQIGLGDFLSQVNLNEGQLETQMYENALNNFMNVMMGTASTDASRISSSPTGLDTLLGGISAGGAGLGALGSATGSSTLSTIGEIAGAAAMAA